MSIRPSWCMSDVQSTHLVPCLQVYSEPRQPHQEDHPRSLGAQARGVLARGAAIPVAGPWP